MGIMDRDAFPPVEAVMKRWWMTMCCAAFLGLVLAACDKDKKEPECPAGPPPGNSCSHEGQSCGYETFCGSMSCTCSGGVWSCMGGHDCPDADADGEVQPEAWDAETDEADAAEDVPQAEEEPEVVEEDVNDEVECPGAPPVGLTCENPGVTCEYDTTCGTMECTCIIGNTWNCIGGHDCPDEDGADGE
jgi:hypothetical protein